MNATETVRKFEIYENGDPYSKTWDCSEVKDFDDETAIFRGDLSGSYDKRHLCQYLRRLYPGCIIRDRNTRRLVRM